jgi:hypothetical protein
MAVCHLLKDTMRKHVMSLCAVAVFAFLAVGSSDSRSGSDSRVEAYTPPPPPSSEEVAARNVEIVNFDWYKGGLDNVMLADFTIMNSNDFPVKDITIRCTHAANSGTEIDRNIHTIYEVVKPKKRRSFRKVNMGFIHSQATRSSCVIVSAVPAR